MMTRPSPRGCDPFSCRERTAIRLATSGKKAELAPARPVQIPPDRPRAPGERAERCQISRFTPSPKRVKTKKMPLPSSLAQSSWLLLPSPSDGSRSPSGKGDVLAHFHQFPQPFVAFCQRRRKPSHASHRDPTTTPGCQARDRKFDEAGSIQSNCEARCSLV